MSKLLLFACLLMPLTCMGSDPSDTAAFHDYMQAASKIALLDGMVPYSAVWEYTAFQMAHGKSIVGKIEVDYASPERWRQTISDDVGYTAVHVQNKEGVFHRDTIAMRPIREYQLTDALSFDDYSGKNVEIRREKNKKVHGTDAECFSVVGHKPNMSGIYCFDPQRKLPVEVRRKDLDYDFLAFQTLKGRVLPSEWSASQEGKLVVSAKLLSASGATQFADTMFTAPSGAERQEPLPTCADAQVAPGILDNKVVPHYPDAAKFERRTGTVIFGAIISKTGALKRLALLQTAGKDLDEAAFEAVKQWRYTPFQVCGQPVEVETEIAVNFTMNGR